jgi:hypothetical protein
VRLGGERREWQQENREECRRREESTEAPAQ